MGLFSIGLGVLDAGASLFGASKAAGAAKDAGAAQLAGVREGIAENRRQFDATQENLKPFLNRGNEAGDALSDLIFGRDGFNPATVPGFSEALEQGNLNVLRNSSATGGRQSGRTLAALHDNGLRYTMDAFNNRINQLASLSGTGQTAGTSLGAFGTNTAARNANLYAQGGDARASSIVGQNNAWQTGIENAGKSLFDLFNPTTAKAGS